MRRGECYPPHSHASAWRWVRRRGIEIRETSKLAFQTFVVAKPRLSRGSSHELKLTQSGFLDQHGVRLRCIGRLDLLKPEMRAALLEMEAATAHNTRGVLNVCGPYASRDEITDAVRETVREVEQRGENPDKA